MVEYQTFIDIQKNHVLIEEPVGDFDKKELRELYDYPTPLDFISYMRYRKMSSSELVSEFPEIAIYQGEENFDPFFYATRGYFKDLPQEPIERYSFYLHSNELTQNLLRLLYGDEIEYVYQSYRHPLEEYIKIYDTSIGFDNQVLGLGNRLGLGIEESLNPVPSVQFYEKIKKVIIYITMYSVDFTTVNQIINQQYDDYIKEHPEGNYNARLSNFFQSKV